MEYIVKLGFTPMEQVYVAWMVYHMGFDLFYEPNGVYVARQVVTNSKGQKIEVFMNSLAFEDLSQVNVNFAPILESVDYHWEIFLWADPPIKVTGDIDLGVPNTWFEYMQELSSEMNIAWDQSNIPEDARRFDTGRNPHATTGLWKSQEKLAEEKSMRDTEWRLPAV